ncbi:unnamed protein product [Sphagnum jensenii]|uniref:Uncharacterized protein n=1 Tax=Sphagnum jensenii TaxID=128206 RepID=A0ABP1B9F4_9BRYO
MDLFVTQISPLLYTLSGSSVEHPCNNFCHTGYDRQTCIRAPSAPFFQSPGG